MVALMHLEEAYELEASLADLELETRRPRRDVSSSFLLLGLGALGLSIRGRRRRPVARKKTSSDVSLSSVPVTSIQGVSPMTRFASLACCLLVALVSLVWLPTVARATAIADVSEIGDYVQLYQHTFPENANYTAPGDITYTIDNSSSLVLPLGFTRVGYYMELESVALGRQWVWASMDTISSTLSELGIPLPGSGITYQQIVSNMNVESNVAGIVTGTSIQTGNIEMWSSSYGSTNAIGIPNATSSYDFGDSLGTNGTGYGSFQIHNYDLDGAGPGTVGQTLLAFNGWTHSQIDNLGIGNKPTGNADWTLFQNANTYTLRSLEVFVLPVAPPTPEPSSFLLLGLGALGMVRHTRRRRRASRTAHA